MGARLAPLVFEEGVEALSDLNPQELGKPERCDLHQSLVRLLRHLYVQSASLDIATGSLLDKTLQWTLPDPNATNETRPDRHDDVYTVETRREKHGRQEKCT